MIVLYTLDVDVAAVVKAALRQSRNNGPVAVGILSKLIAHDEGLRRSISDILIASVRADAVEERRLKREVAGGPGS